MIVQETFDFDGRMLTRTYSDAGYLIRNAAGDLYGEAIDPAEYNRPYTETDIPTDTDDISDTEALNIITGGDKDD